MALSPDRDIDFIIFGAAKCATTWLQHSLSKTEGICMPGPELHFFSREYARGLDWYREQFIDCGDSGLIGEKSNSYLTEPKAAERIARHFPNTRLILQMRDPVERAYSDYCMLFRRGEVSKDIRSYLDPDTASGDRFISDGRYADHLNRFYALFPAENILLLAFEDVMVEPERQLERVGKHIGFEGTLHAPIKKKVKDRSTALVPLPIRRALAPLRPILDPVRGSWPIRTLRNAIAQEIQYPELPKDIETRMIQFYKQDLQLLRERNPDIGSRWKSAAA